MRDASVTGLTGRSRFKILCPPLKKKEPGWDTGDRFFTPSLLSGEEVASARSPPVSRHCRLVANQGKLTNYIN